MRSVVLIIHNVRSAHNVGSLLRTADGLGIEKIYLSGYSPYPLSDHDDRLPHIAQKIAGRISKTALGAEYSVNWEHTQNIGDLVVELRRAGFFIAALEQTDQAVDLADFKPPAKIGLIVGNEISGLKPDVLDIADGHLKIPMAGRKESFNVAIAAAMALYHLKLLS
jgi:23S rRNA (guanosine2251-2'-O)-methyltransferase